MEQWMGERVDLWHEHKQIAMLVLGQMIGPYLDKEDVEIELPMIIVADTSDEFGNNFYKFLNNSYELSDDSTVVKLEGNHSIMLMPVDTVRSVTRYYHEAFSLALIEEPPNDKIWAAVFAFGGLTLMHVPFEPLIPIGQA